MSDRRVVVTGVAVCSPIGCDWPSFSAAMRAGEGASAASFPGSETGVQCHPLSDPDLLGDARERNQEPLGVLASMAARQALESAGIVGGGTLDHVGLVMNTVLGPSAAIESYLQRLQERGPRAARPAQFVDTLLSMPASRVGIDLQLRGSTAVLGGGGALELAFDWVRHGREDVVVAGGGDYLSPKCLRYYEMLAERSGSPRPMLGQAAAFCVLEDAEHASRRGARPLAELLGSGSASEPQDVAVPWPFDPAGRAQAAAARAAVVDASVAMGDVGAVVLACGDEASLALERRSLGEVGMSMEAVDALRPKALTGETLGASETIGVLAAIACLQSSEIVLVNAFEMGGVVTSSLVRVA